MAEDTQPNQGQGEPGPEPENKPEPKPEPDPVPYTRFKQVNEQLRAVQAKLSEYEKREKEREEQELQQQGEYKKLLDQTKSDLETTRAEALRLRVAIKKGIPAELIDRLKGDTEEDLEADADALLALVKRESPGVPPPTRGSAPETVDLSKMTPQEIRDWSEKQGWGRV